MRQKSTPFTHGRLRKIQPEAQTDGASSDTTLGTRQHWRLVTSRFEYETSIVAGARRLRLEIRSGATILLQIAAQAAQTAGLTREYNYTTADRDASAFINNQLHTPLPPNLYLSPGQTLRIAVTAGQIDDLLLNIVHTVEEWISG